MFISDYEINLLAAKAMEEGDADAELIGQTLNLVSAVQLEDERVAVGVPIRILEVRGFTANRITGIFAILIGNSGVYMQSEELSLKTIKFSVGGRELSQFQSVVVNSTSEETLKLLAEIAERNELIYAIKERSQIATLH